MDLLLFSSRVDRSWIVSSVLAFAWMDLSEMNSVENERNLQLSSFNKKKLIFSEFKLK